MHKIKCTFTPCQQPKTLHVCTYRYLIHTSPQTLPPPLYTTVLSSTPWSYSSPSERKAACATKSTTTIVLLRFARGIQLCCWGYVVGWWRSRFLDVSRKRLVLESLGPTRRLVEARNLFLPMLPIVMRKRERVKDEDQNETDIQYRLVMCKSKSWGSPSPPGHQVSHVGPSLCCFRGKVPFVMRVMKISKKRRKEKAVIIKSIHFPSFISGFTIKQSFTFPFPFPLLPQSPLTPSIIAASATRIPQWSSSPQRQLQRKLR